MKTKDSSVKFDGVTANCLYGMYVVHCLFDQLHYEMVITSCCDGIHKAGSKHYSGNAFDLRFWQIAESQRTNVCAKLRLVLKGDYDVVLEKDHIHVEYDPKVM